MLTLPTKSGTYSNTAENPGDGNETKSFIHSDVLYINEAGSILTLTDGFSRKIHLKWVKNAKTADVGEAIQDWRACYGLADRWILATDNASYYASKIYEKMRKKFNFGSKYSIAYLPWSNGGAEQANKVILDILRAICSEYKLHWGDWPSLLPTIQHLYNTRVQHATGFTPNELFFGFKEDPHDVVTTDGAWEMLYKGRFRGPGEKDKVIALLMKLHKAFEERHQDVLAKVFLKRYVETKKRNKGVQYVNFQPGDWVLFSS